MKSVSIGFVRDDGDFQILATLNNKDGLIRETHFNRVAQRLAEDLGDDIEGGVGDPLIILAREDATDYVHVDHEELASTPVSLPSITAQQLENFEQWAKVHAFEKTSPLYDMTKLGWVAALKASPTATSVRHGEDEIQPKWKEFAVRQTLSQWDYGKISSLEIYEQLSEMVGDDALQKFIEENGIVIWAPFHNDEDWLSDSHWVNRIFDMAEQTNEAANTPSKALVSLIAIAPSVIAEATELLKNARYADGEAIVLTHDCEALEAALQGGSL
jgi:hypothetical protein